MESLSKRITRKKGYLDAQQRKIWDKHHEEIKHLLIYHGYKSYREISKILGIDKNTVKKHIKSFGENNFYIAENGRKYLKADTQYIMQNKTFPNELKQLFKRINFPCAYRTNEENIGKVYYLLFPESISPFSEHILWKLTEQWETDFLSRNPYFLKNILQMAINHGYLDKNAKEISDAQLDEIFQKLFNDKETALIIFAINLKNLQAWLKTEKGKLELKKQL
ncbi:MAG: NUMOD1 domain-containing DNA-binding protein [Candidatus Aenigmatarchaeota archaeon]